MDIHHAILKCNFFSRELSQLVTDLSNLLKDNYQLQRQKASEAVVFLCCDLDRISSKNNFNSAPLCWFPKGYSLSTDVMRNIAEEVLNMCYEKSLHVPAQSFDGQFHNLVVRSIKKEPLTLLQLQKDTWTDAQKTQKSEMVNAFSKLNCSPEW